MIKVLIVEDENLIRKGLVYAINWMAMDSVVVGEGKDGREGLEKIAQLKPDVVMTDIKMPKMSGIDMIARAQEQQLADFIPIILTSYSEFEYARKSIRLGVAEYLLKPVDEDELAATMKRIGEALEKRRQEQYLRHAEENSMAVFLQHGKFESPYVTRAVQEIMEHYGGKLTLESVAEKLDISVTYLNKKLKEETSSTFLDLLNRYRVTKAGELLQTGRYKVYEVSDMTGFSDYKHFCAVFKKYTGTAPTGFVKTGKVNECIAQFQSGNCAIVLFFGYLCQKEVLFHCKNIVNIIYIKREYSLI